MLKELATSRWTGWVGYRYLKSKRNSKFLSFTSVLSMLGIGIGVTALIVVLSVMDGFEAELRKRLMATDLHILVTPTKFTPGFEEGLVPESALPAEKIAAFMKAHPEVESFWPVVGTEAMLRSGRKVTGVQLKGVTPERLERLKPQLSETAEPRMLVEHEGAESVRLPSLWIGQELGYEMGIMPGDGLTIISPIETEGPMGSIPRFKRFGVEAIYRSGLPEQELHTVFASDAAIRAFLKKPGAVSHWEVSVKAFDDAPRIARDLRAVLESGPEIVAAPFRVQDWMELNGHLFASIKLERIAMFVVLAFIVIVASFNIVTTLTQMVMEKKREISILRAMGARKAEIGAIFLAEGLMIGGVGVVAGMVLGMGLCAALKRYEFIQLPDIYYDRTLPVTFDPLYYAIVGVAAVVIVLLACMYPSRRAASVNPLDGIRYG